MPLLSARDAALVLIDLQNGIVGMPLAPRSGGEVVAAASELAARFRAAGAPVVLVNVAWAADFGDGLRQPVDNPHPAPEGGFPPDWSDLVAGLREPGGVVVTKHQWGAFFGTDLDVQLRRRGVGTVVVAGIATNLGVESTVRQAWERAYDVVVAEDATTTFSQGMQDFAVSAIFPLISRVSPCASIEIAP